MAITGTAISRVPMMAARKGSSPCLICRSTFSSTTMASSTTRPMASTMASKVIRFMEKPNRSIIITTPIRLSGIVMIGMMTARKEPRNKVITTSTMAAASSMVLITSWMDSLMAMVESYSTLVCMVLGMLLFRLGINSSTSWAMLMGLAVGAALTAMTTASRPLALAR